MDEILIEEKKYVSSKRAAKMTGYAKDYVGQLCREGRVPARLVGRSWYVLESAITDHRFGANEEAQEAPKKTSEPSSRLSSSWAEPRYQPISANELPIVRKIEHIETEKEVVKEAPEVPKHMHEAWQAWFEHVAATKAPTEEVSLEEKAEEEEVVEEKQEEKRESEASEDVKIPIRAIYQPDLTPPTPREREVVQMGVQELKNKEEAKHNAESPYKSPKNGSGMLVIQLIGAIFALAAASLSALSTGYFDTYLTSISQARLVAGVSVYNK